MIQTIITAESRHDFGAQVQDALDRGEFVVPGTMTCQMAASFFGTVTNERWAVVVQREPMPAA